MAEQEPKGSRFEYEKVAAYSLLLSETLFEILRAKGLLTRDEVSQHMEKLSKKLACGTGGVEFINNGPFN
jgi:hypothetical protein